MKRYCIECGYPVGRKNKSNKCWKCYQRKPPRICRTCNTEFTPPTRWERRTCPECVKKEVELNSRQKIREQEERKRAIFEKKRKLKWNKKNESYEQFLVRKHHYKE